MQLLVPPIVLVFSIFFSGISLIRLSVVAVKHGLGYFHRGLPTRKLLCERWTVGDDGVNQLVGMIGYADQINYKSIFAGANNSGGCSQYNKKMQLGVNIATTKLMDSNSLMAAVGGLYCAVQ